MTKRATIPGTGKWNNRSNLEGFATGASSALRCAVAVYERLHGKNAATEFKTLVLDEVRGEIGAVRIAR